MDENKLNIEKRTNFDVCKIEIRKRKRKKNFSKTDKQHDGSPESKQRCMCVYVCVDGGT